MLHENRWFLITSEEIDKIRIQLRYLFQGRYRKIPVIVLIALAELSIQLNCARNDWTGDIIAFRLKTDAHRWIQWRWMPYELKQAILPKKRSGTSNPVTIVKMDNYTE